LARAILDFAAPAVVPLESSSDGAAGDVQGRTPARPGTMAVLRPLAESGRGQERSVLAFLTAVKG